MSALTSNTKYYKEAYNLFQQCSQNEDRHDLANKVFDEALSETSDTVKITKACSRELENLLPYVTSYTILSSFFNRITSNDLDSLIRERSACFVLEKLLSYLPNGLSTENEQIHSSYEKLFQCVCENFHDYIQETGTCHIIASTISFLHPLLISSEINEYEQLIDGGKTPKSFVPLSSEWNVAEKLERLGKLVKKSDNYNELVYGTLLRTCGYLNKDMYEKLIKKLCAKYYTDLSVEHLLDKRSSFIFEVVLEFPSKQRDETIYSMFLNHIDEFYLHSIGNFFFKHLLLTLNQKDFLDQIYQLIINNGRLEKMIQQSHIHLFITFIRTCERHHCHYDELIDRINTAINENKNNINDFIPRVLKLRAENPESQSVTKDGSLVVQALLRARKVDTFTQRSFLSLTSEQIASIACHPSGSHLLCQLILKSSLWPVLQQKNFYNKLDKFYTKMACDKAACWFVTQLWKHATKIEQKLQMAQSMSNDLQMLRSHTYAKFITYEMNLIAYCSRPEQWKRTMETSLKKRALLDDLDNDGKNDDSNNKNQNKKKKKKKKMTKD